MNDTKTEYVTAALYDIEANVERTTLALLITHLHEAGVLDANALRADVEQVIKGTWFQPDVPEAYASWAEARQDDVIEEIFGHVTGSD